jgi:hypothetical protein
VRNVKSQLLKFNWLSLYKPGNVYKVDYADEAPSESILTEVKMETVSCNSFHLPATEEARIKVHLNETLTYLAREKIENEVSLT